MSISQQYIGHARQAGYIAAQCVEGASMGRYVIVVDDDIDPQNLQEVIWALSTRSDPATGIEILHRAPSNPLDPIIKKPTTHYESSRAVIDACKPFEWIDGFPKTVAISKDLEMEVRSICRLSLASLSSIILISFIYYRPQVSLAIST